MLLIKCICRICNYIETRWRDIWVKKARLSFQSNPSLLQHLFHYNADHPPAYKNSYVHVVQQLRRLFSSEQIQQTLYQVQCQNDPKESSLLTQTFSPCSTRYERGTPFLQNSRLKVDKGY